MTRMPSNSVSTATLRIFEPYPGLFAYYDGRVPGRRLHGPGPNWLDDGAYDLGIASYALLSGAEALVYDTHVSLAHARAVRAHLEGLGATRFRAVLSHWHADHVAGTAAFADGEVIALRLTADILLAEREAFARRVPPVDPLVLPTRTVERELALTVGAHRVELHRFDIHSIDGLVLWLPDAGLLLAGDTLEDPVTYVAEPDRLDVHRRELDRLRAWPIRRILPNHGDPDRIVAGGYAPSLIDATRTYLDYLVGFREQDGAAPLDAVMAEPLRAGAVTAFAPYEAVHRRNVAAVQAALAAREARA